MTTHIEILESAISDVGYWRWWAAELPERFQLEFGGTQLWGPPPAADRPPSGLHDHFTLSSHASAAEWARDAAKTHEHYVAKDVADESGLTVIAFWAGPVGFHALCERIEIVNMEGILTPEAIETANAKWWTYWREYWARKDGPDAMPRDYACEVTIPLAR